MKKFKNLMLMLAFALFFVGAMGITKASADGDGAGATTPTPATVETFDLIYEAEIISVQAGAQVYYQVVKTESPSGLKPANWIAAAESEEGTYWIDYSATSNSKTVYFALTTDNTAESAMKVAKVDVKIKSIKPLLKYRQETVDGLDSVISGVEIKGVDANLTTQKGKPAEADACALIWKRGANGDWAQESDFEQVHWDMLKASNGTLYISMVGDGIFGGEGEGEKPFYDYRPSKEAKVKIPKTAKAPTVKIDYAKGTVALKNGMQVSMDGTTWMTVSPYDKKETEKKQIVSMSDEEMTSTKVSTMAINDLIGHLNATANEEGVAGLSAEIEAGEDTTIYVRTAATDKKFMSAVATVEFKAPAAAPSGTTQEVKYVVADKTAKVAAELVIDFKKFFPAETEDVDAITDFTGYEYLLADSEKLAKLDFTKAKWTKVPTDGKLDLSSKVGKTYKLTLTDGTKPEVNYEKTNVVLVRKAADKENKVFASAIEELTLTLTENKTYQVSINATGVTASFTINDGKATKAKAGDKIKLTYTLNENYENAQVTVPDSVTAGEGGVYTVKAEVAGPIAFTITATPKPTPAPQN